MAGGRSGRAALAALMLAASLAPAVSIAGEEVLYGRVPRSGELVFACFARHYDTAHLAGHPRQNVTDIMALTYRGDTPGSAETVFNMTLRFRKVPGEQQFPGVCSPAPGSDRMNCGVECDGGRFTVTGRDRGAILVDVSDGIGSCDGDLPEGAGFASDDKLFRLDRTDMAACKDLIWDDEMRPRILHKAGISR